MYVSIQLFEEEPGGLGGHYLTVGGGGDRTPPIIQAVSNFQAPE